MLKTNMMLVAILLMLAVDASADVNTKNPKTARDFYERGQLREKADRLQEALDDYKKASNLDPEFFDPHFTRSSLHADMKEYAEAIKALASSLQVRPKDYSALFNTGSYYDYLHDYDNAIAYYTEALADDADFSNHASTKSECRALAYHYRGRVYQWHKKDNDKAVADFTAALRLDPDIRMVQYRRARAYHELGAYAQADADFAAAYERQPDYHNLLNAWAWQLATCPDDQWRDGNRALELAQKTRNPNVVAAAYAEMGAFKDAIRSQKLAISQLDRQPSPTDNRAALRRLKQDTQMRTQLRAYEASQPYRTE